MITYVYRGRGWMVAVLALVGFLVPVFALRQLTDAPAGKMAPGQALALAASFAVLGAFVYGFGTRSMQRAAATLGRPLRPHERVFDIATRSPFDSFCFVHLRWWALAFLAIAGWAVVSASTGT